MLCKYELNGMCIGTPEPFPCDHLARCTKYKPAGSQSEPVYAYKGLVRVVYCDECIYHGTCIVEDSFIMCGINDGYCKAGIKGE